MAFNDDPDNTCIDKFLDEGNSSFKKCHERISDLVCKTCPTVDLGPDFKGKNCITIENPCSATQYENVHGNCQSCPLNYLAEGQGCHQKFRDKIQMIEVFNQPPDFTKFNKKSEPQERITKYLNIHCTGTDCKGGPITDKIYVSKDLPSLKSPIMEKIISYKTYGFYHIPNIQKHKSSSRGDGDIFIDIWILRTDPKDNLYA